VRGGIGTKILSSLGQLRRVPFFVWLLLAQAFLLVNASAVAPAGEVGRVQSVLLMYMVLTTAFFVLVPKLPWMKATLNQGIAWFVGGFVAGVVLFSAVREIPRFFGFLEVSGPVYLTTVHLLVVATSEEFIFRGFLPELITPIPAQVAFGLFHFAAYGGDWIAMLVAMVVGFVFYLIARYTNIWTVIGLHAAYNTVVLGVWGV
jgi:membrane protease YdiL (CAAX protease family)